MQFYPIYGPSHFTGIHYRKLSPESVEKSRFLVTEYHNIAIFARAMWMHLYMFSTNIFTHFVLIFIGRIFFNFILLFVIFKQAFY
jgi:hypothetical protein